MFVKTLNLSNFRNYEQAELTPGAGVTVFCGPNAQGKTNILEALHLCCLGRSHRTPRDEELIRWGERGAKVALTSLQRDGTHEVAITLTRGQRKKKQVRVGARQAERIGELLGHVRGVLFAPEDLQIIKSGPSERRRFIDMELSQLYPAYFYELQRAARALSQRNALLREMTKNPSLAATLDLWDEQLAHRGATIARYRFEAVEQLSQLAAKAHASLTGGKETLSLRYITQAEEGDTTGERLLARIRASREDDIRRLTTLVGVHRDDIAVMIDGKDARTFASQGQQRSAVLSVKLAQLEMTEQIGGDSPILMLDDVMSELDPGRRRQLIERIDRVQTFVTCTDVTDLAGARSCDIYRVENGRLLT